MIRIDNLSFRYGGSSQAALCDITLDIDDGEFVLITGLSGGGKSSLCRCLNGLIPHFYGGEISGRVEVAGFDVMKHSTRELATSVGMVFQDPENQLIAFDVEREIAFSLENLSFSPDMMAKRVEDVLDVVNIAALRHRHIDELSGGEKQKVAIASVLALYPSILVLDEPTSELDPKGAEEILALVKRLNDEMGITVVLVEHRLERVMAYVDRLVVLDKGKVVADGSPQSVLNEKKLSRSGIGIPPLVALAHGLRDKGIEINDIPLTVKEARAMVARTLHGKNVEGCVISEKRRDRNVQNRPLLEVKGLWYAYSSGLVALKNVNLQVYPGEFVVLMGRNASGKTTLVKHFNGLLRPTKGDVVLNGINTKGITVAKLARQVGYVFQNPDEYLFCDTVDEEIAFTLKNIGFGKTDIARLTDQVLDRFGLMPYKQCYPHSLSGGEKQRVAIASVLASRPSMIVLDEPTRGMEYGLKVQLMDFLDDYRNGGGTVILVTQDVETVAEYGDRVILLSEGRIVVDGTKREVLSRALLLSPQVNRLAQSLRGNGVCGDILTVAEMLLVLP
ncbi:MAG: ATP-binding cassette domain-containing protein [Dehalococcoidia bacterium]|nr:ATP-binding cassette domain-containing protein [Dehalococcoidia bacterium]